MHLPEYFERCLENPEKSTKMRFRGTCAGKGGRRRLQCKDGRRNAPR